VPGFDLPLLAGIGEIEIKRFGSDPGTTGDRTRRSIGASA
jgi:hypothetical protein